MTRMTDSDPYTNLRDLGHYFAKIREQRRLRRATLRSDEEPDDDMLSPAQIRARIQQQEQAERDAERDAQ